MVPLTQYTTPVATMMHMQLHQLHDQSVEQVHLGEVFQPEAAHGSSTQYFRSAWEIVTGGGRKNSEPTAMKPV